MFSSFNSNYAYTCRDFPWFEVEIFIVVCYRFTEGGKGLNQINMANLWTVSLNERVMNEHRRKTLWQEDDLLICEQFLRFTQCFKVALKFACIMGKKGQSHG